MVTIVLASQSREAPAQGGDPNADLRSRALGVVGIQARIGRNNVRSSGIVVDADKGLVLTNAHSIWGAKSLRVATGLAVLFGRIVARNACDDLALIELQPRVPGLSTLLPQTPGGDDPWVEALGRRFATTRRGQDTLVRVPARLQPASETTPPRALPAARGVVGLDSPLLPEATGAALFDRDGRVWGIAQVIAPVRRAPRAFAIPANVIRQRLDELEPGPRTVFVGWRDHYRCAPRLHAYNREAHPGYAAEDARFNVRVPATRVQGTEQLDQP